jgi:hypothetical protein
VIKGKLIDQLVKLTRLLCLPEEASSAFEDTLASRRPRYRRSPHRMRRCPSSFAYFYSGIAGKFLDRYRTDSAVYCPGNFQ